MKRRLSSNDLPLAGSIVFTPPSISEGNACNAPPRRLQDYADFIDLVITEYGDNFCDLELWNEPNNRLKWDFANFDPWWKKFGEMIGAAGYWAKHRGRRTERLAEFPGELRHGTLVDHPAPGRGGTARGTVWVLGGLQTVGEFRAIPRHRTFLRSGRTVLEGARRAYRVRLGDPSLQREGADLLIRFELPKGSYATVVLDEIIKG